MSPLVSSNVDVPESPRIMDSSIAESVSDLLAVSFSYPPQTEPRAIQVSRLLDHLNVSTVLVCEGQSDTEEPRLAGIDSRVRTLRVPFPNPPWRELSMRVWGQFNLPVWFRTPDHLGSWKEPVMTRIEELRLTE